MESSHKRRVQELERLLKRRVPVADMKSSTSSGKRHSSKSSKSKERKIEEEIKVADVDSIIMENLPAPEDREVGQFQMNDLMTQVLEDELQTIMIEVWRALPDDPPSKTEKYVADKLRNEVSDDLRNVLGLNVAKRLLNVYNPLYVTLHFSHRPESGYLTKFLNSYNVEIFKRINREKSKNTFAARLKSISDFDKICASRHIRCGTARITVAPFYNFTKCPAKLNTVFADNGAVEKKGINQNNSNDDESETIVKESTAVVDNKTSVEDNKKSVPQKKTNSEEVNKSSSEEVVVPQKKTKIEEVKTTVLQKKSNIEEVKTSAPIRKSNVAETIKSVSDKKSNIEEAKQTKEVKCVAEKKPNVNEVKKSVVVETKKATNKNNLTNNMKAKSQTEVKKKIDNRDFEMDETEIIDEIGEYDDNDEMNDEEILALIAGGVVVDECSGSDVE